MPALDELDELIGFELRRAYSWSSRRFSESLSGMDIKPGQYSLLFVIDQYPGETLGFMADRLALDPANLAPLLNDLERHDYIERVIHPKDRRARAIRLKPKGSKALSLAHKAIQGHEKMLTNGLSSAQKKTLLGMLRKMASNASGRG
ncbi:MAG: MarR family winged helix-turn-helix transcriptional regulator [Caulobacteraceae bacterium]